MVINSCAALLQLVGLRAIDLNGNNIETLPFTFSKMPQLISLDVRANPIQNIPEGVLLTARQSHQGGWPTLKSYMIKQLSDLAMAKLE